MRAGERLKREFSEIRLPLLILHSTADKAAKSSGSQSLRDKAGAADKTLKLYEGSYHDPLNDLDRDRVIADIIAWTNARLTSLSQEQQPCLSA